MSRKSGAQFSAKNMHKQRIPAENWRCGFRFTAGASGVLPIVAISLPVSNIKAFGGRNRVAAWCCFCRPADRSASPGVMQLEHIPEKWKPVFRKGHAPTQESRAHPDSS
jgi:hypothetical protein